MSRSTAALDRLAGVVVGLLLIAVGAYAVTWWAGGLDRLRLGDPAGLDAGAVESLTGESWWPVACLVAGLMLAVLAVRWLLAHHGTPSWGTVTLDDGRPARSTREGADEGSTPAGRLELHGSAVPDALVERVEALEGVGGASAALRREGGAPVLALTTRVPADADVAGVVPAAERLLEEACTVLGLDRPAVRHRVVVERASGGTRVVR